MISKLEKKKKHSKNVWERMKSGAICVCVWMNEVVKGEIDNGLYHAE